MAKRPLPAIEADIKYLRPVCRLWVTSGCAADFAPTSAVQHNADNIR
jgi:hypothetical protein